MILSLVGIAAVSFVFGRLVVAVLAALMEANR